MLGHGFLRTRTPSTPLPVSSLPVVGSTIAGSIPKNGTVAEPGFVSVAPGNGVMTIEPVSVCQKVSTIAHCPRPTWSLYQCHASGLIGSPTEPSTRSEDRSNCFTCSSPRRRSSRMAVGAE
jgi:hypothetical protein